jgi:hypothetical protein
MNDGENGGTQPGSQKVQKSDVALPPQHWRQVVNLDVGCLQMETQL